MSWNNCLPAWMLFEESARRYAMMSCATREEWNAGISVERPKPLWHTDRACMSSYEKDGWNEGE